MSNTTTQVVLPRTEVRVLDLRINAVDSLVVRNPWLAGAVDLTATKTVLALASIDASIARNPWLAGAVDLRATKTVISVG